MEKIVIASKNPVKMNNRAAEAARPACRLAQAGRYPPPKGCGYSPST